MFSDFSKYPDEGAKMSKAQKKAKNGISPIQKPEACYDHL